MTQKKKLCRSYTKITVFGILFVSFAHRTVWDLKQRAFGLTALFSRLYRCIDFTFFFLLFRSIFRHMIHFIIITLGKQLRLYWLRKHHDS